jgi:hypothetical protein
MINLMLIPLLVIAEGPTNDDAIEERARRAAVVDRVMGEPVVLAYRRDRKLTVEGMVEDFEGNLLTVDGEPRLIDVVRNNDFIRHLHRDNLDRWVYGNLQTEGSRRTYLENRLRSRIHQVSTNLALSPLDVQKLSLAGRGDIKHLFDRVEVMRGRFDDVRADLFEGRGFLNVDLAPVCHEFEWGPYGEGSLFAKVLRKIENESPAEKRERFPDRKPMTPPRTPKKPPRWPIVLVRLKYR